MLDTAVDLNLTHQFLLRTRLGQRGLLDDFGGVDEAGVGIDELVAFGEAAFTEELSLDIPANANLATAILLELLLDDRLGGAGGAAGLLAR